MKPNPHFKNLKNRLAAGNEIKTAKTTTSTQEVKPPTPELSPEEIRSQQMAVFNCLSKVIIGDLKETELTAINNWYIQGNGKYLIQKNEIGVFGVKTSEHDIPGLPNMFPTKYIARIDVPKIPERIYNQLISFFKDVMKKVSNSEAFAQVYFDKETKEYVVHVPEQEVSGTRVSYDAETNLDRVYPDRSSLNAIAITQ